MSQWIEARKGLLSVSVFPSLPLEVLDPDDRVDYPLVTYASVKYRSKAGKLVKHQDFVAADEGKEGGKGSMNRHRMH